MPSVDDVLVAGAVEAASGAIRDLDAQIDAINADPVNPQHYKTHPSGVECIDIVEHHDFCTGNAIKYLWRAGQKGDELQDLEKAAWYLARRIDRLRQERGLPRPAVRS